MVDVSAFVKIPFQLNEDFPVIMTVYSQSISIEKIFPKTVLRATEMTVSSLMLHF